MCIQMNMLTHIHTHTYTYPHTPRTCIHALTEAVSYVYTHTHMHTYTCPCKYAHSYIKTH